MTKSTRARSKGGRVTSTCKKDDPGCSATQEQHLPKKVSTKSMPSDHQAARHQGETSKLKKTNNEHENENEDIAGMLKEMHSVIKSLCERVTSLESKIHEQNKTIAEMRRLPLSVANIQTQTDSIPQRTYAEVTKVCQPNCSYPLTQKADLKKRVTKRKTLAELPKQANTGVQNNEARSTSKSAVTQVSERANRPRQQINETRSNPDLPRVLIVHDSTLNKVNPSRLAMSYGLNVATRKAYTIKSIRNAAEEASRQLHPAPDCIVLHTGINDLKGEDPVACGKSMASAVNSVQEIFPHAHIVCSKAIPARQHHLEAKRVVFNAHVFSDIPEGNIKNVSFVAYENVKPFKHLMDDLHPSGQGASLVAGNLGRHLHNLFWERPRRRQRRGSFNSNVNTRHVINSLWYPRPHHHYPARGLCPPPPPWSSGPLY